MALPRSTGNIEAARAKYSVLSGDWGTGAFPALPSISANSTGTATIVVSRNFRIQSVTDYTRPSGTADPAGISIAAIDCIAPASVGARPRVRITWANSTAGALTPSTQQYDFYQF